MGDSYHLWSSSYYPLDKPDYCDSLVSKIVDEDEDKNNNNINKDNNDNVLTTSNDWIAYAIKEQLIKCRNLSSKNSTAKISRPIRGISAILPENDINLFIGRCFQQLQFLKNEREKFQQEYSMLIVDKDIQSNNLNNSFINNSIMDNLLLNGLSELNISTSSSSSNEYDITNPATTAINQYKCLNNLSGMSFSNYGSNGTIKGNFINGTNYSTTCGHNTLNNHTTNNSCLNFDQENVLHKLSECNLLSYRAIDARLRCEKLIIDMLKEHSKNITLIQCIKPDFLLSFTSYVDALQQWLQAISILYSKLSEENISSTNFDTHELISSKVSLELNNLYTRLRSIRTALWSLSILCSIYLTRQ